MHHLKFIDDIEARFKSQNPGGQGSLNFDLKREFADSVTKKSHIMKYNL